MQKIIPHLWYDHQAREAAQFYTSLFPNSQITNVTTLHDTPSGDADIVAFDVWGYSMMAISGGPHFTLNPSISLMVNFDPSRDSTAETKIDEVWQKLVDGGKVLMPIQEYPFSQRYGWVEDKYGFSWQLILTDPAGEERPNIIPSLLFTGEVNGKAEEAMNFYLSVFKNSKRGTVSRYEKGQAPNPAAQIAYEDFNLEGVWLAAMDGGTDHEFAFTEGISLLVQCDTQQEIDYYWEKLTNSPESEQCGWLKDKYGVSWQIAAQEMNEMLNHGTREQIDRLTQALMPMKKLDIAQLRAAYQGE